MNPPGSMPLGPIFPDTMTKSGNIYVTVPLTSGAKKIVKK
jgi:hypothetical protein